MNRKETIRELVKEYLKLEDNHPNKKELKSLLISELALNYHCDEDKVSDYLLDGWINNELKVELEEQYGLNKPESRGETISTFKTLDKKQIWKNL